MIGAFRCTSERLRRSIAALAGSEAKPDEESQRSFVAAVNSTLAADGFELAELGEVDGYPDFSFVKLGDTTQRRPKNLIFGSRAKPDLRFRDAVDNDIEIVTHSNEVLVFDEPIRGALLWRDLEPCSRPRGNDQFSTRVDNKMLWWTGASSDRQRARVLAGVKARRYASAPASAGLAALTPPPRMLVQTGSCRRCPILTPYMLWSTNCAESGAFE